MVETSFVQLHVCIAYPPGEWFIAKGTWVPAWALCFIIPALHSSMLHPASPLLKVSAIVQTCIPLHSIIVLEL